MQAHGLEELLLFLCVSVPFASGEEAGRDEMADRFSDGRSRCRFLCIGESEELSSTPPASEYIEADILTPDMSVTMESEQASWESTDVDWC